MRSKLLLIVSGLTLFSTSTAYAQGGPDDDSEAEGFNGGISFLGGIPVGDFGDQLDEMFGAGAHLVYRVGNDGNFGVRLDGNWLLHGADDGDVTLVSPLGGVEEVDLTTTHSAVFLGLGPELSVELGGARPYIGGSFGLAYFLTDAVADWSEEDNNVRFTTRVQHDDIALAYAGLAGILIPITSGSWGVSVDFGASYQGSGEIDFVDDDDFSVEFGRIVMDPVTEAVSMWVLRAGISIAIGAGED